MDNFQSNHDNTYMSNEDYLSSTYQLQQYQHPFSIDNLLSPHQLNLESTRMFRDYSLLQEQYDKLYAKYSAVQARNAKVKSQLQAHRTPSFSNTYLYTPLCDQPLGNVYQAIQHDMNDLRHTTQLYDSAILGTFMTLSTALAELSSHNPLVNLCELKARMEKTVLESSDLRSSLTDLVTKLNTNNHNAKVYINKLDDLHQQSVMLHDKSLMDIQQIASDREAHLQQANLVKQKLYAAKMQMAKNYCDMQEELAQHKLEQERFQREQHEQLKQKRAQQQAHFQQQQQKHRHTDLPNQHPSTTQQPQFSPYQQLQPQQQERQQTQPHSQDAHVQKQSQKTPIRQEYIFSHNDPSTSWTKQPHSQSQYPTQGHDIPTPSQTNNAPVSSHLPPKDPNFPPTPIPPQSTLLSSQQVHPHPHYTPPSPIIRPNRQNQNFRPTDLIQSPAVHAFPSNPRALRKFDPSKIVFTPLRLASPQKPTYISETPVFCENINVNHQSAMNHFYGNSRMQTSQNFHSTNPNGHDRFSQHSNNQQSHIRQP